MMNNVSELISVIIPVYNVENYLEKCIKSITNQTYKNLEIVIVDDGSTDSSSKICDELGKRDSRLKIIHKSNSGVSAARNEGLRKIKGIYFIFMVLFIFGFNTNSSAFSFKKAVYFTFFSSYKYVELNVSFVSIHIVCCVLFKTLIFNTV